MSLGTVNNLQQKEIGEMTDFDNFVTHGIPGDIDSDSDDDILSNKSSQDEFYIPISDAGIYTFEIEKNDDISQTRGRNMSGRALFNFVVT